MCCESVGGWEGGQLAGWVGAYVRVGVSGVGVRLGRRVGVFVCVCMRACVCMCVRV